MIKRELMSQSIDYMLQHLDDGITLKEVANHFHYSEFYFSRIFKAVTGESVYSFIKHLKMDQSAIDIKLKQQKAITDIGLDYGYSSSNFSSAFRHHHSISPTEFRKSIFHPIVKRSIKFILNSGRIQNPGNIGS